MSICIDTKVLTKFHFNVFLCEEICFGRRVMLQVKSMQKSGTGAIRTQFQLSIPKREITNITNSQNTKRTYGQPSEQLVPKR